MINVLIVSNNIYYAKAIMDILDNNNQYVFDTIDRKENLYNLKIKVEKLLHKKMKENRITELKCKITKEVKYLRYNLSYKGTKYLIDIVELLLLNKNQDYSNLKKDVYPIIANKDKTTVFNIKNNSIKATEQIYIECESESLKQYFGFVNDSKPTTKNIVYTIYNKITNKCERRNNKNF